jgi:hypothetical protein
MHMCDKSTIIGMENGRGEGNEGVDFTISAYKKIPFGVICQNNY